MKSCSRPVPVNKPIDIKIVIKIDIDILSIKCRAITTSIWIDLIDIIGYRYTGKSPGYSEHNLIDSYFLVIGLDFMRTCDKETVQDSSTFYLVLE